MRKLTPEERAAKKAGLAESAPHVHDAECGHEVAVEEAPAPKRKKKAEAAAEEAPADAPAADAPAEAPAEEAPADAPAEDAPAE